MAASSRPLSVTLIACLYIFVGVGALVGHFHELVTRQPDWGWVLLTEVLAIVIGIFLLRGQNWARWLALAWMAFHVALSAWPSFRMIPTAIHAGFFILIALVLLHPSASRYFRRTSPAQGA
ncbi:MAG: hypothetical protein WCC14_11960 [Acidobacteriaceae bacterium]